jgi:phage host-nuclease inhibitor protein Gam
MLTGEMKALRSDANASIVVLHANIRDEIREVNKNVAKLVSLNRETNMKLESLNSETNTKLESLKCETNTKIESLKTEIGSLKTTIMLGTNMHVERPVTDFGSLKTDIRNTQGGQQS